MSESLVIVSSEEQTRGRFQLKLGEERVPLKSPSLVSGTDMVWVVTSQKPNTLQSMRFGFTSHRSEKRKDQLNLATDKVSRSDDDSDYDRLMGILMKPDFCEPITAFRCVVLVDAFLITSPDNIHYLIHMQNKERPFALAGIYDHWKDPKTGETSTGFTILTATANPMLRWLGIAHMPVIVAQKNVAKWLDAKTDRRQYLPLIHTFPDELMNGYPVSGKIFSGRLTTRLL